MPVIHAHDLNFMETPGGNATSAIASTSRGASEVSLYRQRQKPGGANPAHTHDREEVLTVLAGSIDLTSGGGTERLAAGDTAIIPANTLHRIETAGDALSEWLIIAPAGIRYFSEAGEEMFPAWAN